MERSHSFFWSWNAFGRGECERNDNDEGLGGPHLLLLLPRARTIRTWGAYTFFFPERARKGTIPGDLVFIQGHQRCGN